MSVELKRLIEKVSHMDITLIAGENGLSNIVSWVHMVETKEASTFLEGGEIAFSTGICLNNALTLLDLIYNIWENHASGIILNIGPFMESIPNEIIDFGNEHDNYILLVFSNYSEVQLNTIIADLNAYLGRHLQPTEKCYMGISKCTKSIRCLNKIYNQAVKIQNLQLCGKISSKLISYSEMGLYKLLMGIEDLDILYEYYDKTIEPLDNYDRINNSNLCDVLRCYINHNGSVKETAEELYVHRNTVNYKLSKTAQILQVNLSDLDTRLQLALGFMIKDMYFNIPY